MALVMDKLQKCCPKEIPKKVNLIQNAKYAIPIDDSNLPCVINTIIEDILYAQQICANCVGDTPPNGEKLFLREESIISH